MSGRLRRARGGTGSAQGGAATATAPSALQEATQRQQQPVVAPPRRRPLAARRCAHRSPPRSHHPLQPPRLPGAVSAAAAMRHPAGTGQGPAADAHVAPAAAGSSSGGGWRSAMPAAAAATTMGTPKRRPCRRRRPSALRPADADQWLRRARRAAAGGPAPTCRARGNFRRRGGQRRSALHRCSAQPVQPTATGRPQPTPPRRRRGARVCAVGGAPSPPTSGGRPRRTTRSAHCSRRTVGAARRRRPEVWRLCMFLWFCFKSGWRLGPLRVISNGCAVWGWHTVWPWVAARSAVLVFGWVYCQAAHSKQPAKPVRACAQAVLHVAGRR